MEEFVYKTIKSVAYASAGGSLVIGSAAVDLVDADAFTIMYMVVAAIGFNVIKEITKKWKNGVKPK